MSVSTTNFIGNVPYQGKLRVHDTPEDQFIGFIKIISQPDPENGPIPIKHTGELDLPRKNGLNQASINGMGDNLFMYFKKYNFDNGTFVNLKVTDENYLFNICFLRIPSDMDLLLVDRNDDNKTWKKKKHIISNKFSGLTLLNIHREQDDSIAKHSYLKLLQHYDTAPKIDTNIIKIQTNGPAGCSHLVSSESQIYIFQKENDISREGTVKKSIHYYILGLITDHTPCYFETRIWDDIEEALNRILMGPSDGKKLGFAHYDFPRYIVRGFERNYGVHILKKDSYLYPIGWEINEWDLTFY